MIGQWIKRYQADKVVKRLDAVKAKLASGEYPISTTYASDGKVVEPVVIEPKN